MESRGPPCRRAAARAPKAVGVVVEDSRTVPRSDLVIMREELVAAVAENLRLRGDMDGKDEEMAAMARRLASLEAKAEGARARGARREDQDARGRQGRGARKARRGAGRARREDQDARGRQGRPGRRQQEARRERQVLQQPPLSAARRHVDGRVPPEKGDRGALCAAGRVAAAGREQGAPRRDAQAGHKPPRRAPPPATAPACPSGTRSPSGRWPTSRKSSFRAGTS